MMSREDCFPDNLTKYRALRDRAIEHFQGMGVATHSIDNTMRDPVPHYTDADAEKGLAPYVEVGRVVGVELSWKD